MIRTALAVLWIVFFLLFVGPWLILHAALANSAELLYRVAIKGVRGALWIAGIRVRVEGQENVPSGVCVFVANHVSNLDPPTVVPNLPRRVAVLAKKEVFRIPILATAMRQAGIIPVDRADHDAAAASVNRAIENLKHGLSYVVFPEGTRSVDGHLKPFKKGSFVMAIQARVWVVPVAVIGTQKLMRKGEWFVRPGEVVLRFGLAVDASQYTLDQRQELLDRVHSLLAANLPDDQRPAAS